MPVLDLAQLDVSAEVSRAENQRRKPIAAGERKLREIVERPCRFDEESNPDATRRQSKHLLKPVKRSVEPLDLVLVLDLGEDERVERKVLRVVSGCPGDDFDEIVAAARVVDPRWAEEAEGGSPTGIAKKTYGLLARCVRCAWRDTVFQVQHHDRRTAVASE